MRIYEWERFCRAVLITRYKDYFVGDADDRNEHQTGFWWLCGHNDTKYDNKDDNDAVDELEDNANDGDDDRARD